MILFHYIATTHTVTASEDEDKREKLLFVRCYQVNDSPLFKMRQRKFSHIPDQLQKQNFWCSISVVLSLDIFLDSVYTLNWVWIHQFKHVESIIRLDTAVHESCMHRFRTTRTKQISSFSQSFFKLPADRQL